MFCSFFTIPVDHNRKKRKSQSSEKPTKVRTTLTWVFLFVYLSLMTFAIISIVNPIWMQRLAEVGIESESTHYKHFGDTFLLQKHDYRQAIAQYSRALEIKPDNIGALVNMGIAYMRLGDERTGLKAFNAALKIENVRKGVIYYNLAEQLERNGKTEDALRYYELALGPDVDPVMVYRSLGRTHLNLGNNELARNAYETALETALDVTYLYNGMLQRTAAASEGDTVNLPVLKAALAQGVSEKEMLPYDVETIRLVQNGDRDISNDFYNLGLACQKMADTTKAYQSFQHFPLLFQFFLQAF